MPLHFFIGMDSSKLSIDFALLKEGSELYRGNFSNQTKEIKIWLKGLSKEFGVRKNNSLFCLEDLGLYNEFIVKELYKKKMLLWVESALQIKRSLGLQRGKSDQLDSLRIAQYCYLHREKVKRWSPPRPVVVQLKLFSALRER